MKAWNRLITLSFIIFILLVVGVNFTLFHLKDETIPNDRIVEINRMYMQLQQGDTFTDMEYEYIKVRKITQDELQLTTYMNARNHIVILPADSEGVFYMFSFQLERIPILFIIFVNMVLLLIFILLLWMIVFLNKQIIRPFHQMEGMAEAIRNRDFTYQILQSKYKFFGKFIWAIDVMREELRCHEQKELELMKEKKVMIASLSHDVKTPLSNIRLYTEALKETLYPSETIMQRVNENCDKIDQYIKDIVSTCKEDLFDFTLHPQSVYLHDVLPILEQEKERITLALIHYEQGHFDYDRLIYADIFRLKEVVNNLVDNAMKYGDGHWIHIYFYEEDHHPILCVENSGDAIDEQDNNAIFQSFYRGHNSDEQQGNGLGLYICKQLMMHMKGEIFMTQKEGSVSFHLVLDTL